MRHMLLGHMSEKGVMILDKQGLLGNHKLEELHFCEYYVFGLQHSQISKGFAHYKGHIGLYPFRLLGAFLCSVPQRS